MSWPQPTALRPLAWLPMLLLSLIPGSMSSEVSGPGEGRGGSRGMGAQTPGFSQFWGVGLREGGGSLDSWVFKGNGVESGGGGSPDA